MKTNALDVSVLKYKYKGKLIRTVSLRAPVRQVRGEWVAGTTRAFINGKRVPLAEGQKVITKLVLALLLSQS